MATLLTVGQIANKLSCPIWQVQYLLKARDMKPVCRVGVLRLFENDTVNFLRQELRAIKRRKESQNDCVKKSRLAGRRADESE